jgi:hypothetical protein
VSHCSSARRDTCVCSDYLDIGSDYIPYRGKPDCDSHIEKIQVVETDVEQLGAVAVGDGTLDVVLVLVERVRPTGLLNNQSPAGM